MPLSDRCRVNGDIKTFSNSHGRIMVKALVCVCVCEGIVQETGRAFPYCRQIARYRLVSWAENITYYYSEVTFSQLLKRLNRRKTLHCKQNRIEIWRKYKQTTDKSIDK